MTVLENLRAERLPGALRHRAKRRARTQLVYRYLSDPQGAAGPWRGTPLPQPTADGRHGPRADVAPAAAAPGQTIARAGAGGWWSRSSHHLGDRRQEGVTVLLVEQNAQARPPSGEPPATSIKMAAWSAHRTPCSTSTRRLPGRCAHTAAQPPAGWEPRDDARKLRADLGLRTAGASTDSASHTGLSLVFGVMKVLNARRAASARRLRQLLGVPVRRRSLPLAADRRAGLVPRRRAAPPECSHGWCFDEETKISKITARRGFTWP